MDPQNDKFSMFDHFTANNVLKYKYLLANFIFPYVDRPGHRDSPHLIDHPSLTTQQKNKT